MTQGNRSLIVLAVPLVLAAALGCRGSRTAAQRMDPATTAQEARFGPGAVAEASGVRMTVAFGEWTGETPGFDREVTPVRVRIENESARPIRVRYSEFKLQTAAGREYNALPPHRLGKTITRRTVVDTDFDYEDYSVAPYYRDYYDFGADMSFWEGPFERDPDYYDDYYATWEQQLPTDDMLRAAVPEGVVRPGGNVSGNLYFPEIPEGTTYVTYRAEIFDANTEERIGEISIPFTTAE